MSNSSSPFGNGQAFGQINEEARKATAAAFDAMSNWRHEMTATSERNSDAVFDKMASAAKTLGWPTEFMDMTRQQIQNASKMQMHMLDQVMGVWEKQMTNPGAGMQMPAGMPSFPSMPSFPGMPTFPGMTGFSGMPTFPGMPSFPGMGFGSGSSMGSAPMFPGMGDMNSMPMVPLQFWMQAAEMWQKSWQQALTSWMETQSSMMGKPSSASKPGSAR